MPRATFPHSMQDVTHAVDGPFGLVVGDLPSGEIVVLKRNRHSGEWSVSRFTDPSRKERLSREVFTDRVTAINHFSRAIGLGEAL
ncbi:hypothetical protein L6R53_33165 [Myxococcota bacterium]|nr:hypothetical protein [Myxococcota bacterium]